MMPGEENQESGDCSGTTTRSSLPIISDPIGDVRWYGPARGTSCSAPPSKGTRMRRVLECSLNCTSRYFPAGSTPAESPARILVGSPPADGTDQMLPPAEM